MGFIISRYWSKSIIRCFGPPDFSINCVSFYKWRNNFGKYATISAHSKLVRLIWATFSGTIACIWAPNSRHHRLINSCFVFDRQASYQLIRHPFSNRHNISHLFHSPLLIFHKSNKNFQKPFQKQFPPKTRNLHSKRTAHLRF